MATFQNTLHVSEHSADGKLYALLSFDGKLKVWNTETNELQREFVPNFHLNAPFTCFTWITVNGTLGPRKTPQKKSQRTTEYIALGTRSGGVSLYSYSKSEIECTLKGVGHQGSITAICRGTNNVLFTCGDDCRVITWNLETGSQISSWEIGNEKPSSLVYLAESNRLVVAARQLYLWSVVNQELEQTYTGHSSSVTMLKYFVIKSKEFILSASKADRILTLWRIKMSKKCPNSYSYLMEDIANSVATKVDDDKLEIAAVTRSGVLHYFGVDGLAKIEQIPCKPMKPTLTIEIANDSPQLVEPIPICTVGMEIGRAQKKLQIGYGDRQVVRFELIEPDFNERRQVLIRSSSKSVTNDATTKKRTTNALKTIAPIVNMESVEFQSKDVVPRKGKNNIEIPMETRLENLTFDSLGQSSAVGRNVAQLLVQALHSHDANLLKMVFLNKDEQIIRATLKRLPPQYISSLIAELTALAQKKTIHVHTSILWLKHLLQTQSSQLMAIGTIELYATFGPLLGIAEHRANTFQQLTKLSGRLDLLVNQIKQNTDHDIIEDSDLLVYEDKDSSDEDGIPQEEESSDDQWEDGEEEDGVEGMEVCENGNDSDMESDNGDDDDDGKDVNESD
ncbi:WD repeat-containing protein 43 [Contarinia nasturtii]|uniref:WD repeat-containing protein 43 n=1 Tax=Contarinia nasturtii TaxID=265458 RepID=UPI0012D38926|nr:WD repeat-containing protein 43 [Contarinia nasturtii]